MTPTDKNTNESSGEQPATEAAPPILTIDVASPAATPAEAPPTASIASEAVPSPKTPEAVPVQAPGGETVTAAPAAPAATKKAPASILVIDIGGTKVKILASGQTKPRKAPSGKDFTPARLVETVRERADDWEYEAISIGYPGLIGAQGPRAEPENLGPGWVGFDFAAAFGKPVKMVNDAA